MFPEITHDSFEGLLILLDKSIELFVVVDERIVLGGHLSIHAFQLGIVLVYSTRSFTDAAYMAF